MKLKQILKNTVLPLVCLGVSMAHATPLVWNWSFAGEVGQFLTDGSLIGSSAPAGTYNISDFIVTSSGAGMTLGSLSGGQYSESQPVQGFLWDGSAPTQFFRSGGTLTNGSNFFEFGTSWVYGFNPLTSRIYDVNNPVPENDRTSGELSLSVDATPVPEPSALGLLSIGLLGLLLSSMRGRNNRK